MVSISRVRWAHPAPNEGEHVNEAEGGGAVPELGSLEQQARRLVDVGALAAAGGRLTDKELFDAVAGLEDTVPAGSLLVVSEAVLPASALAPLLRLPDPAGGEDLPGFIVEDMVDVDEFAPTAVTMPESVVYAVADPGRGDELRNASPAEALEDMAAVGREPMTLAEGIHWVLQAPEALGRNTCFMTIASRKPKPGKNATFDSRTPALWISNGTGRDGAQRKNAPKVGWCWWNNRHTWLGFASTTGRIG